MTGGLTWRRSSKCSDPDTHCVEVAKDGDDMLMRNPAEPEKAPLRFTKAEWVAFVDGVNNGEMRFDR